MSRDSCKRQVDAEHRGKVEAPTSIWITENNELTPPAEEGLLGKILNPYNLNRAYLRVVRNRGSYGVDRMDVDQLRTYLKEEGSTLIKAIRTGNYRPNPVRRVEIPKGKTGKRPLGIPTVFDRVIQQAIHQVLSPIYERQFSDNSFGFRPGKSTHKALHKCRTYLNSGYGYAVDMDMEKFFDTVNHSKLIEVLSRTIEDGRVVSLIHKYLNAGVLIGHKYETTEQGVPQGGPLSPLLSNIMLNELDTELTRRGHHFVRYADDMVILCKSKRGAERVNRSVTSFIEKRLYLRVNKEKTKVVGISQIKFLGYSFYWSKGEIRFRIHPKSVAKMRDKIRELTSRSNGWSNSRRKERLTSTIKGWINYFKYANMKNLMGRMDEWYRRRLRMVIWKQWKKVRTRIRNLVKLGIPKDKAWGYSNTRRGYWRISMSPVLTQSITNALLKESGYVFFSDYYLSVRVN